MHPWLGRVPYRGNMGQDTKTSIRIWPSPFRGDPLGIFRKKCPRFAYPPTGVGRPPWPSQQLVPYLWSLGIPVDQVMRLTCSLRDPSLRFTAKVPIQIKAIRFAHTPLLSKVYLPRQIGSSAFSVCTQLAYNGTRGDIRVHRWYSLSSLWRYSGKSHSINVNFVVQRYTRASFQR